MPQAPSPTPRPGAPQAHGAQAAASLTEHSLQVRDRGRFWTEWLFFCLFSLILASSIGLQLYQEHQRVDQEERERLSNQTAIVEKNLIPQLVAADRALETLIDNLRGNLHTPDARQLQSISDLIPAIRTIMILDEHGVVTSSNKRELLNQNLGKRPYFELAQMERSASTLYITPPFMTVLDTYVVNLVRTRVGSNLGFEGVVVATLDPSHIEVLLDSVRYTSDAASAVVHASGKTFVQLGMGVQAEAGKNAGSNLADTFFARHQISGNRHSVLKGVDPDTKTEMLASVRTVQTNRISIDKPLFVIAARPVSAMYSEWRGDAVRAITLLLLLLAGGTVSLFFHQHRQRAYDAQARAKEAQRLQAELALRESERRFQALSAMSSDWFWKQDDQFRFTEFSGSFAGNVAPPGMALGKTTWDLPIDLPLQQWIAHRSALYDHQAFKDFEFQISDAKGRPHWYSLIGEPCYDANGRFTGYQGTGRNITQHKASQAEIENLAFYDPLTKLPNRRLLIDRVQHAMATSQRTQNHGALLFIDLDNFKTLNDTLGHSVGDILLQQVAQRLNACVREGDTVARLGGDEFVVMLENLSSTPREAANQTEAVGAKILAALNRTYMLGPLAQSHHSTPSIGIALFHQQSSSVDELLKHADLAMYQAKKAGRNAVRFFDPEMQRGMAERSSLEADLRAALTQNEFALFYQPQVDAEGKTTGVEALLRWRQPQRGMVSPAEFIPLAEETGLILQLGQWVLLTACQQLAKWSANPATAHWNVAVNISAHQMREPGFVDQVRVALERTGASAQRLKLELTESLLFVDIEDTILKMNELKSYGVGFSLDDFGTGYSSLSYLKRLPLHQLKIDRSFVRDVLVDPNDAAIIRTIVALAQSLGLHVIAEGVETEEQRAALAEHGCFAYQGYWFGKPVPPEELVGRT